MLCAFARCSDMPLGKTQISGGLEWGSLKDLPVSMLPLMPTAERRLLLWVLWDKDGITWVLDQRQCFPFKLHIAQV